MSSKYDLVIKNGRIYDGSGGPCINGDIAVKDGKIAGIGEISAAEASQKIDAEGMAVSPGFIDAHSHVDLIAATLKNRDSQIVQGVTTEVGGQCGLSLYPVNRERKSLLSSLLQQGTPKKGIVADFEWTDASGFMDRIDKNAQPTDIALLTGHNAIRLAVMGYDNRKPNDDDIEEMKKLLRRDLDAGCVGMSSGLVFFPGCFADTEELVKLCKVVASCNKVYATHIRGEGSHSVQSVTEAISTAERSGVSLQISHHKVAKSCEGLSKDTLKLMDEAKKRGVDISFDVYPYTGGPSFLSTLLPRWASEGGLDRMLARLTSMEDRERIKADLRSDNMTGWENILKDTGYAEIMITSFHSNPSLVGKTLLEIADEQGKAPDDALLDAILESSGEHNLILLPSSESDMMNIIKHPLAMIGSDGWPQSMILPTAANPHPRCFGTFPRVLGHISRDKELFPLETAVYKMTGFPAWSYGLEDRGLIKEGLIADLVIFDPKTVNGSADSGNNPRQAPKGIYRVIKNGTVVVEDSCFLGQSLGKAVRR